jgi:hypothetical protein
LSAPQTESFRFALRVRHPHMDPEEISQALGIEPEHAFRAGDVRRSRHEHSVTSVHPESYWLGALNPAGQGLDVLLATDEKGQTARRQLAKARGNLGMAFALGCVVFLKTHEALLRRICAEGGEVALLVTILDGEVSGFTLHSQTSRYLGELGVAVEFEFAGE